MLLKKIIFFVCLSLLVFCSCKKEERDYFYSAYDIEASHDMVSLLNNNIINLQKLAGCYLREEKLLTYSNNDYEDEFRLFFELGGELRFSKLSAFADSIGPSVSMVLCDSVFLWTISGSLLVNIDGMPYEVSATGNRPVLSYDEGVWNCQIGDEVWIDIGVEPVHPMGLIDGAVEGLVMIVLPSGSSLVLPCSNFFEVTSQHVPNRAFYKSVFLDAGIGLTSRRSLHAATFLGLSLEAMSFSSVEDMELQNKLIEGDSIDINGRLLYPDGQPRYQMLFVNGGQSKKHGQSLSYQARENMRRFNRNGGSYIGTCAGAFFASNGDDIQEDYPYYLHIWPQIAKRTHLAQTPTGFFIEPDSPLLDYYDFGGDLYVENVRHNGGCYADEQPLGGEILARYDYPDLDYMHLQPSAWAYKENQNTGRIVQIGSHPEEIRDGERRDFTAASMLYAMDGCGSTQLKGFLQNGIWRDMTKSSLDYDPYYTMIGDLQCHHFMFYVPEDVVEVSVDLKSDADVDMTLMLNKDIFAYPDNSQFISDGNGCDHCLSFHNLSPGIWYAGVRCNTTVTTEETSWGQEYTGRTDVLNGVPYSIRVSWTTLQEASILQSCYP